MHFAIEDSSPMNPDNTPLVTAVIPVYNHEKYVVESIRSILHQTYRNIELIILNDGSNDRSHEMVLTLVEECKRRFVRFEYINRENIGLSATLNQALGMARGVYFTALASDDVASPEKIELLVNALEAKGPKYAAAFGNALFIDDASQEIHLDKDGRVTDVSNVNACGNFLDFYTQRRDFNYRGEEFGTYASLISGNYLPAMSNVVRTSAVVEVGAWTVGNMIEDWEMWLKLSQQSLFVFVDRALACYRWHDNNSVRTISNQLNLCSLRLLKKEKQYCARNGFLPLWRKAYTSLLLAIMSDKRIALSEKLSVLDVSEISYVTIYLAKRLTCKL
jgi:alpha-1,3-rhamnosyltransferase